MEEISRLKSILGSSLKHVINLESKSKDVLANLKKELEELKEKYRRNDEKRENLERKLASSSQKIESLEKELELEKSTNEKKKLLEEQVYHKQIEILDKELLLEMTANELLRMENTALKKSKDDDKPANRERSKSVKRGIDEDDDLGSTYSGDRKRERRNSHGSGHVKEIKRLKPLTGDQIDEELKERDKRKNQMLINDKLGRSLEDIRKLVKDVSHMDVEWKLISTKSDKQWLVEIDNIEQKCSLIWKRNWFKDWHCVYFRDNSTPREKEVQEWLKMLAQKEREKGKKVFVSYMKIKINDTCKVWDEKLGGLQLFYKKKSSP